MKQAKVTDPVCHMTFPPEKAAAKFEWQGETYYFCNPNCKKKFQADPARYLGVHSQPKACSCSRQTAAFFICPMHPEVRQNHPGSCPKCGMDLEPQPGTDPEVGRAENRRMWGKFIAAAVLSVLLMLSMPMSRRFGMDHPAWLDYLQWLLASLAVFGPGGFLLKRGIDSLRAKSLNMFTLISLGILASYFFSVYAILLPDTLPPVMLGANARPYLYFESSAMIVALIILGQLLEAKARSGAERAIRELMELSPPEALQLQPDGSVKEIPLDAVKPDDRLRIVPGARIPVDGVVESGSGTVDESMLTGEAVPVGKTIGSPLAAGTLNGNGSFVMRASKVGKDTLLAQIIDLVSMARNAKAPIQQLVDKVAAVFVPTVVLIALLALGVWGFVLNDWAMGFSSAIAVLLVACPCVLGLATPMAVLVGSGLGARHGILIKDPGALEMLRKVRVLIMDKTGTLTQGHPVVTRMVCNAGSTENRLLQVAASLEQSSEHPLAGAVLQRAKELGVAIPEADDFQNHAGEGVSGKVDGSPALLGSRRFLERNGIRVHFEDTGSHTGQIFVAVSGKLLGYLEVSDPLRSGVEKVIADLKSRHILPFLATGDSVTAAETVAQALDIADVYAELLPADKFKLVKRCQKQYGVAAMIGDGINDAAALAAADSSIAMGSGTDAALANAGITLLAGDIRKLSPALKLSDAVHRCVVQNLCLAFAYNVVMIPLASGLFYAWLGWRVTPVAASIAMSISSLLVVGNALRLGKAKLED